MNKEILVQADSEGTIIAVTEDRKLVEFFMERPDEQRLTGNIYKGTVENIIPGMQAAFVDIGLKKNSFLYVKEATNENDLDDINSDLPDINDVLKKRQQVMVQVIKEPVQSKGARVSTRLTLPGRYLVLMPTVPYIGISRRIEDEEERQRLNDLAVELCPEGMGLIVRTVAFGATKGELAADLEYVLAVWEEIKRNFEKSAPSSLLYRDESIVKTVMRDVVNEDVTRIIVDSEDTKEQVASYLHPFPGGYERLITVKSMEQVFDEYNLFAELKSASRRRVYLDNGSFFVIDSTEALTTIDVNSGKFIGTTNDLEDTVFNTNMQVVPEIVRQIRLRNLGGIIIIDFIDMDLLSDRDKVVACLEEELKRDRIKTNIMGLTQLGLLEMTRKKTGHGLSQMASRFCPHCEGQGKLLNPALACVEIRHILKKEAEVTEADTLLVQGDHDLVSYIKGNKLNVKWAKETGKRIMIKEAPAIAKNFKVLPSFD